MTMRYAVVGAGLAGLTAAYELKKNHPEASVQVFEATDRIGGKLLTIDAEHGPTDMGAEAFINFRRDAHAFFDELGIKDRLVYPAGRHSRVYSGGMLQELPRGGVMGIPASSAGLEKIISAESCARIDAEAQGEGIDWTVGEDRSLGRLVRDRYGDDVVERLVDSMLGGVYSCNADDLGVRATVPQLAQEFDAMTREGAKVTLSGAVQRIGDKRAGKTQDPNSKPMPVFAAFDEGYQVLYERLAEASRAEIYVDSFVTGVEKEKSGYKLIGAGEGVYDGVILATPGPTVAMQLKKLCPAAAAEAQKQKLASCAVVSLKFATDEALPNISGVLVASDEPDMHAKAFTISSKKWDHYERRGGALVRVSFGKYGQDEMLREDPEKLIEWAQEDLRKVTGYSGELEEAYVQVWWGALPRYDAEHLTYVAAFRDAIASLDGLEVCGAWIDGVGVPAIIAGARAAAQRLK